MAPRETENNAYAKFWVKKKEHYSIMAFSGPIVIWVMLQTWKSTLSCNLQLSVNLFFSSESWAACFRVEQTQSTNSIPGEN